MDLIATLYGLAAVLTAVAAVALALVAWRHRRDPPSARPAVRTTTITIFVAALIFWAAANLLAMISVGSPLPNADTNTVRAMDRIDAAVTDAKTGAARMLTSNSTPTISAIADRTIDEDMPIPAIEFTVRDIETPAEKLTVSASSSNENLIPNASIEFGGTGASRAVSMSPRINQTGTARITLTVSDGALSSKSTFGITINPVNAAPAVTAEVKGLEFRGVASDYVDIPDARLDGAFTFEVWLRVNSYGSWARILEFGRGTDQETRIVLGQLAQTGQPVLQVDPGEKRVAGSAALPKGKWLHLAAVNDGAIGYLYVDGQLAALGPQPGPRAAARNSNFIAKSSWSYDAPFDGAVREVRVWRMARTQAEIRQYMNRGLIGSEPGLALYYRMNEGIGELLHDGTLQESNGTIHGSK